MCVCENWNNLILSHTLLLCQSHPTLSLSLSRINTHTNNSYLKCKGPQPVQQQSKIPVEFKICGGWITGLYFLPAMKPYFALKQQNYFKILANSLLCHSQDHSFSVKRNLLQITTHCDLFPYVFIFVLFYWPKSLVTHLFLYIFWTMVWSVLTT